MDIRTQRLIVAFRNSGMTQKEICEKTGINPGALSSYLSGRYFPKQKALEALSNILSVPIDYLMGIEKPNPLRDAYYELLKREAYLEGFETLSDEGKEKVKEYIDFLHSKGEYEANVSYRLVMLTSTVLSPMATSGAILFPSAPSTHGFSDGTSHSVHFPSVPQAVRSCCPWHRLGCTYG